MTRARPRGKILLVRTLQVLGALVVALVAAEMLFRTRDLAAFPHLRCYQPDPELGLRLEPGRVERIRFGGAEVTTVRINADGLRGPALPPPGADEVLVVGDSQAFGLGVEDDQTFSAVLAQKLGRTVVNAGIPTYGPMEYARMVERRLDLRPAKTVIVLLAYQNDFFEAERPNSERHAAWDGWAVRKESAPGAVLSFPGRQSLYRDSHLVYAWRRWLHGDVAGGPRVASGGSLADFLPLVEHVEAERATSKRRRAELGNEAAIVNRAAQTELDADALVQLLREDEISHDDYVKPRALIRAATAHPGDIVEEGLGEGEEGLSLKATASVIAEGAKLRERLIQRWWDNHGDDVKSSRAKASALQARLNELRVASNPIAPSIRRIAERCKRAGATLIVVGLPTDTMITPAAFQKYGEDPVDMSQVDQLTDDLRVATEAVGAAWVDLKPLLTPLGLSGFLPREFHLSVAGHMQVGAELARLVPRLALPRPHEAPQLEGFGAIICEGCGADVEFADQVDVHGNLHLQYVTPKDEFLPPNLALTPYGMLANLMPGEELTVWSVLYSLRITRTTDGAYHGTPTKLSVRRFPSDADEQLGCRDESNLLEHVGHGNPELILGRRCFESPDRQLLQTFPFRREADGHPAQNGDSAKMQKLADDVLACASGDATFATACRADEIRVGPGELCRALCDAENPCPDRFRCVPYRGTQVCAPLLATDPTCFRPTVGAP